MSMIIRKIKDIFKLLFYRQQFCKYCKWHVKEWNEKKDICKFTFETYINEIGQTLLRTYGDIQRCEMCGHIEHDGREIRCMSCLSKNKEFKCIDFKKKWYIIYKIIYAKSKVKKEKK